MVSGAGVKDEFRVEVQVLRSKTTNGHTVYFYDLPVALAGDLVLEREARLLKVEQCPSNAFMATGGGFIEDEDQGIVRWEGLSGIAPLRSVSSSRFAESRLHRPGRSESYLDAF